MELSFSTDEESGARPNSANKCKTQGAPLCELFAFCSLYLVSFSSCFMHLCYPVVLSFVLCLLSQTFWELIKFLGNLMQSRALLKLSLQITTRVFHWHYFIISNFYNFEGFFKTAWLVCWAGKTNRFLKSKRPINGSIRRPLCLVSTGWLNCKLNTAAWLSGSRLREINLEADVQIFVDSIRQCLPANDARLPQLAEKQ